MRLAADNSKIIFNINIELIAMLLHKWRKVVVLDKDLLVKMMSVLDSQESSHLWKMTAIQMLALACTFNLPVRTEHSQDREPGFRLEIVNDPLLTALLK